MIERPSGSLEPRVSLSTVRPGPQDVAFSRSKLRPGLHNVVLHDPALRTFTVKISQFEVCASPTHACSCIPIAPSILEGTIEVAIEIAIKVVIATCSSCPPRYLNHVVILSIIVRACICTPHPDSSKHVESAIEVVIEIAMAAC